MDEPIPMNEEERKLFQFGYEQGQTALEERVRVLEEKMRLLEPTGY